MNLNRWPWTKDKPAPEARLTWAHVAAFRSPALRIFGAVNVVAALFYGGLGTYGILSVMFGAGPHAFTIADMIQLLERSLSHSAVGGAAFIADYVMTKIGAIAAMRGAPPAGPQAK